MKDLVISGYALCWEEKAFIEKEFDYKFYEQFQRGAFSETIKKGKQNVLLFHKRHYDIVNEKEGNLTLMEDEKGLAFRIELPNNSESRLTYNLVETRTINHVSIGFTNAKYELSEYRHFKFHIVKSAELREISLLHNPAYKSSIVRTGCNNPRLNLLSEINKALKL